MQAVSLKQPNNFKKNLAVLIFLNCNNEIDTAL